MVNTIKDLVLVRHGRTRGNEAMAAAREGDLSMFPAEVLDEIRNSHSMNERLVQQGFEQLKVTGSWIANNISPVFEHYMCSPFPRAIESAAALQLPGAWWQIERDLRERDHGLFDRLPPSEIEKLYPDYFRRKGQARWLLAPPGGESLASVCLRIRLWLRRLEFASDDSSFIAVSHYETMSVLLMWLTNMSIEQYHVSQESRDGRLNIPNGSVIHFTDTSPFTGVVKKDDFGWYRKFCPWDPQSEFNTPWTTIDNPLYTNEELQEYLDQHYPQ